MSVQVLDDVRPIIIEPPYTVRKYGVTEDEYDAITALTEDVKVELLDGVMIVHSPEKTPHERAFKFLMFLMYGYAEQKQLGEVLSSMEKVHLATCRKVKPDVLFVRKERQHIIGEDEIDGSPDLVVEILSESTRHDDLTSKRTAYRDGGVGEIWFVDTDRQEVIVDRKQKRGYQEEVRKRGKVRSSVIEGFWIEVSWLWQDPLPNPMTCLQQILASR